MILGFSPICMKRTLLDNLWNVIFNLGTIVNGAALLHAEGAREVYACCTHAVFR